MSGRGEISAMLSPAWRIARVLPRSARGLMALVACLRAGEASILFLTTVALVRIRFSHALFGAIAFFGLSRGRALVRVALARSARESLFAALGHGLLRADAMDPRLVADHEAEPKIYSSLFEALRACTDVVPMLVGEAVASITFAAVLAPRVPLRVALVSILSAAAAVPLWWKLQARARRAALEESEQFDRVMDGLSSAVRGRVEIVAGGYDDSFLQEQGRRVRVWVSSSFGATALGLVASRLPAILLGGAALAAWLTEPGAPDIGSVEWLALLAPFAGALPTFAAAVRDATLLARLAVRLDPLAGLMAEPARLEAAPTASPRVAPPRIAFRDVAYRYGESASFAVENLSFEWEPGELLVLSGLNGSGKSTCFGLLLGLAAPRAGHIEVDGRDLRSLHPIEWRRRIAYLPQRAFLSEQASVRDAVSFGHRASDDLIVEVLQELRIWQTLTARSRSPLDVPAHQLSVGQRQRLLIARALAANTPVVLLDEPDAALDREGLEHLVDWLGRRKGRSVAIAAHNPEILESADRIVRLPASSRYEEPAVAAGGGDHAGSM